MTFDQESLLTFPCDLPIKIFGRNVESFRETAVSIVRSHYGDLSDDCIGEQVSREDTYLSLTITVRAENREQVDAVYRELSASGEVLIVL